MRVPSIWAGFDEKGVINLKAATEARILEGHDTDYELYRVINKVPGFSVYQLAKETGWSIGKVYGSIRRLEREGLVHTEKSMRDGRTVLSITPVEWYDLLTPEQLKEFDDLEF
jgi:DNA-binding PadR family transcriptional regulator